MTIDAVFIQLFILIGAVTVIISRVLLHVWVVPLTVYMVIWLISIGLSRLPIFMYEPFTVLTWQLIILSFFTFAIGALSISFVSASNNSFTKQSIREEYYILTRMYFFFYIALILKFIHVSLDLLQLWRLAGGWAALISDTWIVRAKLLNAIDISSPGERVIFYVFALSSMSIFWGSYIAHKEKRWVGILPVILEFMRSVLTLQRYLAVIALLLFLFSFYYYSLTVPNESRIAKKSWNLKILGFIFLLLLLILTSVIIFRNSLLAPKDVFTHIIEYIAGPAAGFNMYINGYIDPLTWGKSTFWGWASWLQRFGIFTNIPPYHYAPVLISPNRGIWINVYTYLRPLYDDWGLMGIILAPYFLGLLVTSLHVLIVRGRLIRLIPYQSILMATIVMSFYTFLLKESYYWLLILGVLMSNPFIYRRRRNTHLLTVNFHRSIP